jgi:hypothetical protein
VAIIQKTILAKFGYIIDIQVGKKNRILLYSWLPSGSYDKTLAIWNFFNLKFGEFGPLFSREKSFV